MPCTYDPGPSDYLRDERAKNEKMKKDLDRLTAENDQLREALLNIINKEGYKIPATLALQISKSQEKHRKEDLARLRRTFTASKDAEKLGLVMLADPSKELEPQLGFDPDEF